MSAFEVEERWIPIHVSGDEWAARTKEAAEEVLRIYPPEWTFDGEEDGGPNGLSGVRVERRYITPWREAPRV